MMINNETMLKRYSLIGSALWTLVMAFSLAVSWYFLKEGFTNQLKARASEAIEKDLTYRMWNASHGGVYVPVNDKVIPNPHLVVPNRDLTATDGMRLTLVNPAYMTRMVNELQEIRRGITSHLTSLNPIRPQNAADQWESEALWQFENGAKEYFSFTTLDGKPVFRSMEPFIVEESCLKCHSQQGYKLGQVRGGISVSIPILAASTDYQRSLFSIIAGNIIVWLIGVAVLWIGSKRLASSRQAEINAHEYSQRMLLNTNGFIQSVLDAINANIAVIDEKGTILFVNLGWKRFADENGANTENYWLGLNYLDFCSGSANECSPEGSKITKLIKELIVGTSSEFILEYPCHNSSEERWSEVRGALFHLSGESRVLLTHHDITRLRESQKRTRFLATAIEASSQAFANFDANGRILEFNPALCDLTGYSANEIKSLPWNSGTLLINLVTITDYSFASLNSGQKLNKTESELIRKDGSSIAVELTMDVVENETGHPVSLSIFLSDISERKNAQEKLRESEIRFRSFVELAPAAFWTTNSLGEATYISQKFLEIMAMTSQQAMGRGWLEAVHPDDRDLVNLSWSQAVSDKKPFEAYFRVQCPDGNILWVLSRGIALCREDGSVIEWMGTLTDVTELRQARDALLESQVELTSQLQLKDSINAIFEAMVSRASTLDDVALVTLEEAMKRTHSKHGYVNKTDPRNGDQVSLTLTKMFGKECNITEPGQIRFPKAGNGLYPGLWGHSLNTLQPFFTNDPSNHPVSKGLPEGHVPLERFLSVPVIHDGELVGQISLANPLRDYDDKDLEVVRKIAEYYALALERNRILVNQNILNSAIFNAEEGVIVADSKGIINNVNPAFEKITGYTLSQANGKSYRFLGYDEHNPPGLYNDIRSFVQKGSTWRGVVIGKRPSGELYHAEFNILPVFKNNKLQNIVAIFRDISNEMSLKEQLDQSRKLEAIGTLAGGIAHDFNNIIFGIYGNAELIGDIVPEDSLARKYSENILGLVDRAADMVNQILTFSRKSKTEKVPLNILLVVKESLKFVRSAAPASVEISANLPPGLPNILADRTQIYQIMVNLCSNAIHAMKDAPGTLSVSLESVHLDMDFCLSFPHLMPGLYIKLVVSDTGMGIQPAIKQRIFEPYFTTKDVGEGTGMGLAVIYSIVRDHGGIILVDSQINEGSVFTVFIPAVDRVEKNHNELEPKMKDLFGKRILVVDDEKILIEMIQETLQRLGMDTTASTSPNEALDLFRQSPSAFDIVMTDLSMPGISGIDLSEEIRSIRTDIPIILCTGFGDTVSKKRLEANGICHTIQKPISRSKLGSVILEALGDRAIR